MTLMSCFAFLFGHLQCSHFAFTFNSQFLQFLSNNFIQAKNMLNGIGIHRTFINISVNKKKLYNDSDNEGNQMMGGDVNKFSNNHSMPVHNIKQMQKSQKFVVEKNDKIYLIAKSIKYEETKPFRTIFSFIVYFLIDF